jgi:solute carrier family 25 protein 44
MATSQTLCWSDIDKVRFFGIGTVWYSALTIALHPMTVLKTRQQVLNTTAKDSLLHQHTLRSTYHDLVSKAGVRGLFRGAGIIVSLAIPARVVYISVLEWSRQECHQVFTGLLKRWYWKEEQQSRLLVPLVASVSGGVAGGLAAMSAQLLVVPMDVISQRQIVMNECMYAAEGSAWSVMRSAVETSGWRALYRGLGLSLFSSLPTGSIWWATYGGCQHWIDLHRPQTNINDTMRQVLERTIIQIVSGTNAAFVAATLTQPLDVVKTRLQVGTTSTLSTIVKDFATTSGVRGFYRGLGPRIMHMSVWGTVLSSAYELLRHVSRK